MQTHFLPQTLSFGKKTRAHWAIQPSGTAVVFVHGFGGDSVGTWGHFPDLLPAEGACAGWDFVYYGYDGMRTRAFVSAVLLLDFLDALLTDPAKVVTTSAPRPASFAYSKVVLVAHSLGAIVTRQALVEAGRSAKPWVQKVQLVLFAPAHMGADILTLGSSFMTGVPIPFFSAGPAALKASLQALLDLEPGCATLIQLLEDTRALLPHGGNYLVARRVVLGETDRIINPNRFADDPTPRVLRAKGHTEVCKPDTGFRDPVIELVKAL